MMNVLDDILGAISLPPNSPLNPLSSLKRQMITQHLLPLTDRWCLSCASMGRGRLSAMRISLDRRSGHTKMGSGLIAPVMRCRFISCAIRPWSDPSFQKRCSPIGTSASVRPDLEDLLNERRRHMARFLAHEEIFLCCGRARMPLAKAT